MSDAKVPYKIYLTEEEMPKAWYNLRADMKNKPAPLLNPGTGKPLAAEELTPIFCEELVKQELDNDTKFFDIPEEILSFYKMFRPSPLVRAYCLEEKLQTPAKIYYKFEGNNTSGSHKLNSARILRPTSVVSEGEGTTDAPYVLSTSLLKGFCS